MSRQELPDPKTTANRIAQGYLGVGDDTGSRPANVRDLLIGAVMSAVLIPGLFLLMFGEIGGMGWGLTVFFTALPLLWAIGLAFQNRTEYHSPVKLRGDWADRLGAFWLISCAFGPLFGWILTAAIPLTETNWQWLYGLRIILAAALPLITVLPNTRYVRGKSTLVALPILVVVTVLPMLTVVNASRDLWEGADGLYLPHTERVLEAATNAGA